MLLAHEKKLLDEEGFLILENFMDASVLETLRHRVEEIFSEDGERAGVQFKQEPQTRRLANLVDRGEMFVRSIAMPRILELVAHVIGYRFKLSSLNVRSANPHSGWVQPFHCDAGAVADDRGFWVCNTIWLLHDFTADNGAPRYLPGSHHWGKLPQDVLENPAAYHPDEKLLLAKAGTVIVMNTHLWHGATANRSAAPRTAMHAFYCRWDKPQQQYQKRLLRPEVQARLNPELRKLLALDDSLNDALSAEGSGMSGFLK